MRTWPMVILALGVHLCANAWNLPLPDVAIDDTNVYPESLSSAKNGTLYIGSLKGIVFRANPGSAKAEPWIQPTPENGLLSVFGVLTDERTETLWICSSPTMLPNPPTVGTAALMAFNLSTGTQKGAYLFPAPASLCNDITIAPNGTAYASDTLNGRILKLAPRAKSLEIFAEDERLKGIDGLVMSGDGKLYVNIVTRGLLLRVDIRRNGAAGEITQLTTSVPLAAPDGFRLIHGRTYLLAEGDGGRIDEVMIHRDHAQIRVLRDGLIAPPAVTVVGRTAYALEGKINYLINPRLKGQDPGPFIVHAVPLDRR